MFQQPRIFSLCVLAHHRVEDGTPTQKPEGRKILPHFPKIVLCFLEGGGIFIPTSALALV